MNDYSLISRVFTRNVLNDFTQGKSNAAYEVAVENFISDPTKMTHVEIFEALYKALKSSYRNEYYYKNTLLNKLLLGVHNTNTTTALTELPLAKAKGDFILINGKAVVYEIKTGLDNLDRIQDQIENYYKVFDHVSVVTCDEYLDSLFQLYTDTPVGIYSITKAGTIHPYKSPFEYKDKLDPSEIFATLRKNEYENLLMHFYGKLPEVSTFDYYSTCRRLFCDISIDLLYDCFLSELKLRHRLKSKLFNIVPQSLISLSYFCNFDDRQYMRLNKYLIEFFRR